MERVRDGVAEAAELAKKHRTVVLALGSNPVINAKEISDRTTMALPPDQARLLRAVAEANPRVALVLLTNYPYLMSEANGGFHFAPESPEKQKKQKPIFVELRLPVKNLPAEPAALTLRLEGDVQLCYWRLK